MKRIKVLVLLLSVLFGLSAGGHLHTSAQSNNGGEVLFTIPMGEKGENRIQYEGVGVVDALTWGPSSFTVADDGSFWIANTVGNSLLHYDVGGTLLGIIDLEGLVVGATDVEVANSGIWVLDQSSMPPKVLSFAPNGTLLEKYDLPLGLHLEDGLSGIGLGDQEELLIEREGDTYITQFTDAEGNIVEPTMTRGYTHNGVVFSANSSGIGSATPNQGTVVAGDLRIEIKTEYDLGGVRILGFGLKDDIFVILEELSQDSEGALLVDQTVRHYDASGKYLGVARVPLSEQYIYVQQGVALGSDGSVYFLATRPDRVEIWRLSFEQSIPTILFEKSNLINSPELIMDQNDEIKRCVTRDTIVSTAYSYVTNSKYLSSTNTDGSCAGRQKPRYLSGAGTYSSVSYDWGGFDTVSGFNSYMSPNTYTAGDINTTSETCSRGVDCSGYVSRARRDL
ncbi:MAG TPA: hypothetical protein DCL08_01590 [Anaerolineaceae bacterium]|nr:hypothetical protein [Anaerolineaceae bacterium]